MIPDSVTVKLLIETRPNFAAHLNGKSWSQQMKNMTLKTFNLYPRRRRRSSVVWDQPVSVFGLHSLVAQYDDTACSKNLSVFTSSKLNPGTYLLLWCPGLIPEHTHTHSWLYLTFAATDWGSVLIYVCCLLVFHQSETRTTIPESKVQFVHSNMLSFFYPMVKNKIH